MNIWKIGVEEEKESDENERKFEISSKIWASVRRIIAETNS